MAIACGYTRVSGKGQVEGDGEHRQRQAVITFCSANNLALHSCTFEAGVSGTIEAMDRPAFAQLIEYIEGVRQNWKDDRQTRLNALPDNAGRAAHNIDWDGKECAEATPVIVVERMDRLARDLMVQELLLAECRKRRIKVYAADQGLIDLAAEDSDPTRKLIRQVLGALAEWEKSALVKKLSAARTRKKQSTGRCEGAKPFGYYANERGTYERLIDLIKFNKASVVAQVLNAEGRKPRHAAEWNRQLVANVIEQANSKKGL